MNKKTAQTNPHKNNLSGSEASLKLECTAWKSLARDEIYEKRIFELECYVQQLETLLMITESKKNQKYSA